MTTVRMCSVAVALAALAAWSVPAGAQVNPWGQLMGQTDFSATDRAQAETLLNDTMTRLLTSVENAQVNAARGQLLTLTQSSGKEFRAFIGGVVATALEKRLSEAKAQKNRLAAAVLAARMQNQESIPVLLKLLGEGSQGEAYSSVRYWAAKGLAGDQARDLIVRGTAVPIRVVLDRVREALERETDPICAGQMFKLLQVLGTDNATDVLIDQAAARAKKLDLSNVNAVDAMRTAAEALKGVFEGKPAATKQRIVATLVQMLVRTPPYGTSLDLASTLDDALSTTTREKSGLAEAVKDLRGQTRVLDPKLIDVVWMQELNWVEMLLKSANGDVKLTARPEALDWTPLKSVEVVRKMAAQQ